MEPSYLSLQTLISVLGCLQVDFRHPKKSRREGRVFQETEAVKQSRTPIHKEDIKAAIHKRGVALSDLSLENGLDERTCAMSLARPIPAGNTVIADFLGLPLHVLWPRWYDQQGNRLVNRNKTKTTRKQFRRHCKKQS